MLKTLKKFMATISAVVLCAVPMTNSLSVNAASTYRNTYRVYFDVPANSGLATYHTLLVYTPDMDEVEYSIGNLGGTFTGTGETYSTMKTFEGTYTNAGSIVEGGTLFTIQIDSNSDFLNNINSLTGTARYANGNAITPNPVTKDIVLVGDANGNDVVEVADAVLIQQYLANPSLYPINDECVREADANGDGVITSADATMIERYMAQIIPNF